MADEFASLREHLELAADVKVLKTEVATAARELKRQAIEYERRLGDLNGEQARLRDDRERYLPREIFQQFKDTFDTWRYGVDRFVAATTGRDVGIGSSWSVIVAIGTLVVAGGCGMTAVVVSVVVAVIGRT